MPYNLEFFYSQNKQLFNKAKAGDIISIFSIYNLLISRALDIMPICAPGLEEEYPQMCSLLAHEFMKEAEQTLLPLAEKGNVRAQLNLVELYYNGFESPLISKAEYWSTVIIKNSKNIKKLKKITIRQIIY